MNKIKELFWKFRDLLSTPSHNRTLVVLGIVILAIVIPVTVVFLGKQTNLEQSAHIADCPIIELRCGKDPDVASYCTNASSFVSTDQVHIDTTVNCGKTTCGVTHNSTACGYKAGVGGSCGVNADCAGGGSTTYCSRKGICTKYCTPSSKANVCSGEYLCTGNYNVNKECGATNYTNCKKVPGSCGVPAPNPTCSNSTEKGTCYTNNSCGGGMHEIVPSAGHTCSSPFRICCAPGAPTPYPTLKPTPQPQGSIKCGTNNAGVCYYSVPGNPSYTSDWNDLKSSADTPLPSCDTMTAHDFLYDSINIADNNFCVGKVAGLGATVLTACCQFTTPVSNTCANNSEKGTCYTNNSCGSGMHEIDPVSGKTCGTGYRICCAPGAVTPPPHTCSTVYKGTCQPSCNSADQDTITNSAAVLDCTINSKGNPVCCAPKGGGGGGGGNPTATPIPCKNGQTTSMALNLKLEGIGSGNFENNNPISTRSAIYIKVTDQNNAVLYNNTTTTLHYTNGTFNTSTISLGTSLSCGHTYTVAVKIPRYLPVKGTVTYAKSNVIALNPIVGDINKVNLATKVITGDDQVSVLDYSLVRACRNVDPTTPQPFTDNTTTVYLTCAEIMNFFDYADGGTQGDEWAFNYNLWTRGYFKANGY